MPRLWNKVGTVLYTITVVVNFFFLIAAVWLGIYIVTRSVHSPVASLTSLTLWSLAGLFLNVLLALNPPPSLETSYWHTVWHSETYGLEETLTSSAGEWLLGWLVTPALAFWYHATVLMLPGRMNRLRTAGIILVYLAALVAILVQANFYAIIGVIIEVDPLYLNSMVAGPLFPFFISLLLIFVVLSIANLLRSARQAPQGVHQKQFNILILATLVAGLTGPVGILGTAFGLPVPMVVLSLLLGIAVSLLGYGVARYSALMEGRTLRRDFLYNLVAVFLITLVYLGVTGLSVRVYNVPASAFVFVVILVIITHSVIDIARLNLDKFFYQREKRQLRENLRNLASLVGEQSIEENLTIALESLCRAVRATYGLIIIFDVSGKWKTISYHWSKKSLKSSPSKFFSDDVTHLEPGGLPEPLEDAALLVPFYDNTEQIGALVLGRPVNGTKYSAADVEMLLYPSDQMVEAILRERRDLETMRKLAELSQAAEHRVEKLQDQVPIKDVEDALRNLWDYSYLGDTRLAELSLVCSHMPNGTLTHLDRGKGVHNAITDAIEKLRPEGDCSCDPPSREWYPYLILHGAYLEDKLNRDIMSRLYISEGTFNRTRRSAIRAVQRVLEEMEAASH